MSISEAREGSEKNMFQLPTARAVAAQVVHAVALSHSRSIIHADLHEGNILVELPPAISKLTVDELYARFGPPQPQPVERADGRPLDAGVPASVISPLWLSKPGAGLPTTDASVLLSDFGEAVDTETSQAGAPRMPMLLRAPELLLDSDATATFQADIWSLGCMIFRLLGRHHLFYEWFPDQDRVLEDRVDALGKLPEPMWSLWPKWQEYFGDDLRRKDGDPRWLLKDRFEESCQAQRRDSGWEVMSEAELQALLDLLSSMLSLNPATRPSAREIVKSRWIQHWAMPECDNIGVQTAVS